MRNYLKEFFDRENNISYEIRTDLLNSPEGKKFITINITCVYMDFLTYHYFIDSDKLDVWDYSTKIIQTYNNFSKLADEANHFQQMTVHDHIGFEPEEVTRMMNYINGIRKNHETKSTKRTRSTSN